MNVTIMVLNETMEDGLDQITPPNEMILWGIVDLTIIMFTLAGNLLTAVAIRCSRKLSAMLSNQFIFNLAVSDMMVAIFIPYHYAFYVGNTLGSQRITCLLRFSLTCLACSCSIYNLLAIATDRYIAILYPLHYGRYITRRIVYSIICFGWIFCFALATVPFYWNTWESTHTCELETVLPPAFINFVLTPMFGLIWLVMLLVYFRICREASDHAKRIKSTAKYCNGAGLNDSKSLQMVLLIMGCFSVCWLPYFGVLTYNRIVGSFKSQLLYESAFILAMANSAMNPIIYAWKNTNFRKAFSCLVRCRNPNVCSHDNSFITNHVPSKKNSAVNGIYHENDKHNTGDELGLELRNTDDATMEAEHSVGTECTDVHSQHA